MDTILEAYRAYLKETRSPLTGNAPYAAYKAAKDHLQKVWEEHCPKREQELVELGRNMACCCAGDHPSIPWCELTFPEESRFPKEGA